MDDSALLRRFAENGSDKAFAVLVARHVNLVYSVALRQTGQPHNAEEITQAVFIILARKAAGLRHEKALTSWLFQTTRLTANNFVRTEMRRRHREQEAYMQSVLDESTPDVWPQIAPLLDQAVDGLREKDRQALLLRFYEGRNLREVGAVLGASEDAAEKRVSRALEKLRKIFAKRGVNSSAAAIAESISTHSLQAAPVALAKSVTAVAMAKGSLAAASTMTLVKGTMKTMTWLKLKFAMGVGAVALLAGGIATVAFPQTVGDAKLTAQEIAKQSQSAYAALSSYSDDGTVTENVGNQILTTTFNIRLQRPNRYRITWTQTGGFYTSKGEVWSDGAGNFFVMGAGDKMKGVKPQKMQNMQLALGAATGVSGSAASVVPGTFFNQPWGDQLRVFTSRRSRVERKHDAKMNGTDCFVISFTLPSVKLPHNTGNSGISTTTLWIGKHDHLIHHVETTMEGASITPPPESGAALKTILERQNKPVTPEAISSLRAEMEKSLKAAQGAKFVSTQTHENISVNQKFSPSDFER